MSLNIMEGALLDMHQDCAIDCKFDAQQTKAHLLHHIQRRIPTVISCRDVGLLPTRRDFASPVLYPAFAACVRGNKPILFMPVTITEKNEWVDGGLRYAIYMFGVMPCGSKACVVLRGVPVHMDIMVPDGEAAAAFEDGIRSSLIGPRNIKFTHIETVQQFRFRGFQTTTRPYIRVHFGTLQERKKCAALISEMSADMVAAGRAPLETAADDSGRCNFYFPKVAREMRFATADWNRFERYELLADVTTNCEYTFAVDVADFKRLDKQRRAAIMKAGTALGGALERDPTMVCQWDIETYRSIQNGIVPSPIDQDWSIRTICSNYYPHHSAERYLTVCVTAHPSAAREGIDVTIVCPNERELVIAHMDVCGAMAPDIMSAFNGGHFDWPIYRERCRRESLLVRLKSKMSSLPLITKGRYADTEESVLKWHFGPEKVKIDAENTHELDVVAKFDGMLDTDVLPTFLRLYTRMETPKLAGLNYFLKKNGLPSKDDMPYKRMFKVFERGDALRGAPQECHCGARCTVCDDTIPCLDCKENIGEDGQPTISSLGDIEYTAELLDCVAGRCCYCGKRERSIADNTDVNYYCMIDCHRPQQLCVKRTIVYDKRALSAMSYMALYDSYYRADGMKVCNFIGKYCLKRGVAFSNRTLDKSDSEKDHYPGAYVFQPRRGRHSDGWFELRQKLPDGSTAVFRRRCRPITGLDAASLYPSLMMTYNLCPHTTVKLAEEAARLAGLGYVLHHIEPFVVERGPKKGGAGNKFITMEGWTVRHNGIINPKTNGNIISYYEKHVGDAVDTAPFAATEPPLLTGLDTPLTRKVSYVPVAGRPMLPGEQMGIFPFIMKKLFDKRVPVKAAWIRYVKAAEAMEKAGLTETTMCIDGKDTVLSLDEIRFRIAKVDAAQKALKVLSNTFYGKSGDFRAPIYDVTVAAGITTAGQATIKKVAALVERLGFTVHYGDTDSVYISCPDCVFAACDAEYEAAMEALRGDFAGVPAVNTPTTPSEALYKARRTALRIRWWEQQVRITMEIMVRLREIVGDYLLVDNGTRHLTFSYEEVGFPSMFCGMKKYFLTPHIETINFYPEEYMIRGIDIIKQGQSEIMRRLGMEFIREVCAPETECEPLDTAVAKITQFYSMEHGIDLFRMFGRYKPEKKNVSVHTFVARMVEMKKRYAHDPKLAALYDPPAPGDKFEYVVCVKATQYSLQGTRLKMGKGDKMEYVRVYLESQKTPNPMVIDLNYYMEGSVIGVFARFICYHPMFQPPPEMFDLETRDGYRSMDQYCITQASKHLMGVCTKLTGYDHAATLQVGRDYRSVYGQTSKAVQRDVGRRYGAAGLLLQNVNVHITADGSRYKEIVEQLRRTYSIDYTQVIGAVLRTLKSAVSIFAANRVYNNTRGENVRTIRVNVCHEKERVLTRRLYELLPDVAGIVSRYENRFVSLIEDMRKLKAGSAAVDVNDDDLEHLNGLTPAEEHALCGLHECIIDLAAVWNLKAYTLALADKILVAKATVTGPSEPPNMSALAMHSCVGK